MNKIKAFTVILSVLALINLPVRSQNRMVVKSSQSIQDVRDFPKIKASDLIAEINRRKKANPKINARQLAAFANRLLTKKGFNYLFDMSELYDQKSPRKDTPQEKVETINFPLELTLADDTRKTFTVTAKRLPNECFDESYPAFPLIKATSTQATLMIDGKPNLVKIPSEFHTLSAMLVDSKTRKRILQNWILPYSYGLSDYNFVGLSRDGKMLYLKVREDFDTFETEEPDEIKELALEIAGDGNIRFVPMNEVKRKFKWEYLNDATEINDALVRLTINGTVFILAVPVTTC